MKKPPFSFRPRRFSLKAMTLVEVTIAIGIAAFVAIPIMGLFAIAFSSMGESTERFAFLRIYQSAVEAAKPVAEQASATLPWNATFGFTREILACEPTAQDAYYRAECDGAPGVAMPGGSNAGAWAVTIRIYNIPQQKMVFERATALVKSPSSGNQ